MWRYTPHWLFSALIAVVVFLPDMANKLRSGISLARIREARRIFFDVLEFIGAIPALDVELFTLCAFFVQVFLFTAYNRSHGTTAVMCYNSA